MATLYKADGTIQEILPRNQTKFSIEELHKLVDGDMVERWKMRSNLRMVMDEDAKLKGKPINTEASKVFSRHAGGVVIVAGDAVVGTTREIGLG